MNTTVKMIVVLGLISAISAGLLAGVNMLTADTIKANSEKRLYETLAQVIEADEFEAQEGTEFPLWLAKTNGEVVGYVVRLTGHGYSSDGIDLLVGLDAQATVKGVLVFSHSETPGLGSKVAEQSYLAQFVGKGLDSAFVPGEDVDAISGATSSSMAVIGSVRKAVDFVGKYAGLTEETGIDFANIPDGEYVGKGRGFGGDITVKLTFAGGKLTALEIVSHNESPNVSDPAIENLPQAIIDQQTVEVDAVSGATMTSEGIIAAVKDALAEFSGEDEAPIDLGSLLPGKYTGTARGFSSDITVEVTIAAGKILDIVVVSQDDTPEIAGPALATLVEAIIEEQSLEVDLVSGATYSSEGLVAAVKNALRSDPVVDLSLLPDGNYTGEAEGFSRNPIRVSFTMKDGAISALKVMSHGDTPGLADDAFSQIIQSIESNLSLDVDLVSGATYSSQGLLEAIINAIKAGPRSGTDQ
ncbi:MAG TPA: FMN-binding protein [Bacillota bacterium]|nr:FMN-binding protein [Bacillota bacterium]HQD19471.1 FMN-binding protein [Bacillota bacterium]